MLSRQSVLAKLSSSLTGIDTAKGKSRNLVIFGLALATFFFSFLFVALSLPSFLRHTQRVSFMKVARTDSDGGILDSYARHSLFYRAGVTAIILATSVVGAAALGSMSSATAQIAR